MYYRTLLCSHLPTHTHFSWALSQKTAGKKGVFTNGTASFLLVKINRETWRMWRCILYMHFVYFVHALVAHLCAFGPLRPVHSYVPQYSALHATMLVSD